MWNLIEREVYDNIVHVASLFIVSAMIVGVFICAFFWDMLGAVVVLPSALLVLLLLGFCLLGVAQMYGDRVNRISSLLSTLAVTRSRIFLARVLVGMVTVLVVLVPGIVGTLVLLWAQAVPLELFRRPLAEVSVTIVLTGWACYSVGLLVGWTTNRAHRLAGFFFLLVLVLSLVGVKGFGPEAMVILLLFIAAALLRTWHTFTSTSL